MSNIVWFLIITAVLVAFIVLIIAAGKSKSEDDSENYNPPDINLLSEIFHHSKSKSKAFRL